MSNSNPSQVVDPRIQERFKRRIHSPQSMAPNVRSRQLHLLTWTISLPLVGYVALFADFGEQEHCFSPLRRWFDGKRQQFWSLTPEEEASLRAQGRME